MAPLSSAFLLCSANERPRQETERRRMGCLFHLLPPHQAALVGCISQPKATAPVRGAPHTATPSGSALPLPCEGSPLLLAPGSCSIPCSLLEPTFLEIIPFEISSQFEGALFPAGVLTDRPLLSPAQPHTILHGSPRCHVITNACNLLLRVAHGPTCARPSPSFLLTSLTGETSWRG